MVHAVQESPSPYVNQSLNLVRIPKVLLIAGAVRSHACASHSRKSVSYASAVPSALHSASAASSGASWQITVEITSAPSVSQRFFHSSIHAPSPQPQTRKQPQLCSLFLLSSLEKFQTHAHFMPRRPRASRSLRQKSEARSKFILHIYPNSHCLWSATDLVMFAQCFRRAIIAPPFTSAP